MHIRRFRPGDEGQIAQLFHDTIHTVNRRDYSPRQLAAWAPTDLYFRDWLTVCANRFTLVADDEGQIAGFAELEAKGHIDCFYCHRDYQGQGVGRQLYQGLEEQARTMSLNRLFVEASITARPFFERMGFVTLAAQSVPCRGETFLNYTMEKWLSTSP
jgi:putative acetyltransferase